MQQIDVDFDVWKALTVRRTDETHSYNDVLRDLLSLPSASESGDADRPITQAATSGRSLGGRFLPNGSSLRARYKGQLYQAEIRDNQLVDCGGKVFGSASAAASAITGTNVNGLSFWEVKRPADSEWRKLLALPKSR